MFTYISMEIYIKVSQEEAMNNKEKIGTTELTFLVMSICLALFPAFGTATVINYGKNTAIISVIIGSIIGLIPLFMILYIIVCKVAGISYAEIIMPILNRDEVH